MARTISIGVQDFGVLRANKAFYVDKTAFIREWWDSLDAVMLITRPRRFGKTLNMSMLEYLYLDERKYDTHFANTSGNGLVGKLIREGDKGIKTEFEKLLNGGVIEAKIDEQIILIEEKKYEADLLQRGISPKRILKYGFAFEGEKCLIRKG